MTSSPDNQVSTVVSAPSDDPPPRTLIQKRFGNRTRFELRSEDFNYELVTEGSSRTFRMDYADLSADRETLTERNVWLRNVGLFWLALGGVLSAIRFVESQSLQTSIWLWLGLICLAAYQFRTVRYRIIPAERYNVLVIDDAQGAEIIGELEARRGRQLRARFDYLSPHEHPEQQRQRIHWLQKQGVLDANETSARLLQLQAMATAHVLGKADESDD